MNFSEKLDFLMNLTKTSNKELAEALYFSQSYVSKLRRGHRTLNDNVSIEKIGAFLSSRIFLPSQIAELKKTVNWIPLGDKPDNEELKVFLLEMFYFNNIKNTKKMNEILNHLSTQRKIIDNEVKVYSEADLAEGWIKGYPDGSFRPERELTRAEAVTIVNRMLDRIADKDYVDANVRTIVSYTDLSKAYWAYYDIMEASNSHDYERLTNRLERWTRHWRPY